MKRYQRFYLSILLFSLIFIFSCFSYSPYTTKANVTVNKSVCQSNIDKIAVIEFDTSGYKGFDKGPNLGENLSDQYALELMKLGYNVIERTRIDEILNEMKYQSSDLFNSKKAIEVGNLLGVKALVFGTVTGKPNMWGLTVRLVFIKTGELAWLANSNLRPIKPAVLAKNLKVELEKQKMIEKCK